MTYTGLSYQFSYILCTYWRPSISTPIFNFVANFQTAFVGYFRGPSPTQIIGVYQNRNILPFPEVT